jgi:uncharacterized protein YkwD
MRARYLWALLAVPVLIVAGLYLAGGPGAARNEPGQGRTTAAGPSPASSTGRGPVTDVRSAASCAPVNSMSAPCSVGRASVVKMPAGAHPGAPASAPAAAPRSAPASTAPPAVTSPAGPDQRGTPADRVLALINQARNQAGRPALTFSAGLDQSTSAHNLQMASGCGLSHQCPGEPPISTRETDAGMHWTAAGENIGEAGPEAGSTAAIAAAAAGLTQDMLDEKPPDDGHRLNILSSSFAHIGIAVYRSSSGTVWLTQDFSN